MFQDVLTEEGWRTWDRGWSEQKQVTQGRCDQTKTWGTCTVQVTTEFPKQGDVPNEKEVRRIRKESCKSRVRSLKGVEVGATSSSGRGWHRVQ